MTQKHISNNSEIADTNDPVGIAIMWLYILILPVFIIAEAFRQLYKKLTQKN